MLSVVIPTCHRNDTLARLLDCLAPGKQTLDPAEYEVIVTDAGTKSTAREMVAHHYGWAKWVSSPGKPPGANRNAGARHARGEWLVFIDDDCLVGNDFLGAYAAIGRQDMVEVMEGRILCPDPRDHPLWHSPTNPTGGYFWSGNLAVRRSRFLGLQGFDEELGRLEDMEFAHRLAQSGLRAQFVESAVAMHPSQRLTWRQYWQNSLQSRWSLLYRLKTGQSPAAGSHPLRIAMALLKCELSNLLRTNWHCCSRFDRCRWKSRLFAELWKWATLPVVLPYLLWWEFRFRRETMATRRSP